MVNETKTFAEYKTPKCRVLKMQVQNLVCTSPNEYTQGGGGYYDDGNTIDNGEY